MILFCTSVLLHPKWYNVYRSRDSKDNAHLIELLSREFLGIAQKLKINYFSKMSLDGYFKLSSDISLCHSKAEESEGQIMDQSTGKSD